MDISVNIDIWGGSGLTALYGEVLHEYGVAINSQCHIVEVFFYRNMPVQTKKSNYQDFQVSLENVSIITLAPELPGALEVEQTRIFFLGSPMFSSPIYLLELCTFFVR